MSSFGPIVVTIIANGAVFISIPMHVLLFRALRLMKKSLNTSFHVLVRHISVLSLICSVFHMLIEVPFQHPPLDTIVPGNPFWENIVGYLIDISNSQLSTAITLMHVFTALNRFIAIMLPEQYQRLMTIGVTSIFCYSVTIFMVVLRMPTVWPLSWYAYHPTDKTTNVIYAQRDKRVTQYYTFGLIVVGFIVFFCIYLSYSVIAIKLFADKVLSHNKTIQKTAKMMTLAAAIMVLGTVFTMTILLAQQYFWYILKRDLMPTDWLRCLLEAGSCFSLSIHPWCLMILFPDIRKKMFNFRLGHEPHGNSSAFVMTG